jgi:hypothetical protein
MSDSSVSANTALIVACISLGIAFISCLSQAFSHRVPFPATVLQRLSALERRQAVVVSTGVRCPNMSVPDNSAV